MGEAGVGFDIPSAAQLGDAVLLKVRLERTVDGSRVGVVSSWVMEESHFTMRAWCPCTLPVCFLIEESYVTVWPASAAHHQVAQL